MKTMRFESSIVESEKVSPMFNRVKIHVAYEGLNRNNSFISRETFEKAAETAKFCPIVGEWSDRDQDFKGHGGKVIIENGDVNFIDTTRPFGCISNEDPTWEMVTDANGTTKEYFTVYGYLWVGRYPELNSIIEQGFKNQSMEVLINDGEFQKINGEEAYVIKDMTFSGFCILGNSVEPCFEDSTISTYSTYKIEFNMMLAELKSILQQEMEHQFEINNKQGGNEMTEEKDFEQETVKNKEEMAKSEPEVVKEMENQDAEAESKEDPRQEEMAKKPETEPDGDEEEKDTDSDGDGKYELLESEFKKLKEEYSLLEEEVKELRQFKLEKLKAEKAEKINEVFSSVADELTESDLSPFKEKAFEMEIDDLKKELYALIGQKAFEAKKKEKKPSTIKMSILEDTPTDDVTIQQSYDAIIKKYVKK